MMSSPLRSSSSHHLNLPSPLKSKYNSRTPSPRRKRKTARLLNPAGTVDLSTSFSHSGIDLGGFPSQRFDDERESSALGLGLLSPGRPASTTSTTTNHDEPAGETAPATSNESRDAEEVEHETMIVNEDVTQPSLAFAWGGQRNQLIATADKADYEVDADEPDSLPVVKGLEPTTSKTYPKSAVRPDGDAASTNAKAVSFNSDTYYKVIERLPEWADSEPTEALDSTGIAPLGNIAPYSNSGAPSVGDEDVPIRIPERLEELIANADYVEELRAAEKAGKLEDAGYKGCAQSVANTFVNENADMDGRSDASSLGSVDFESVGPTTPLYSAEPNEKSTVQSPKLSSEVQRLTLADGEDDDHDDALNSIAADPFLDYAEQRKVLSGPITTDALRTIAEEALKATAVYAERMAAQTAAADKFVSAAKENAAALEAKVEALLAANAELKAKNGELQKENGELKIAQRMMGAFNDDKVAAAEAEREEAKVQLAKAEEMVEQANGRARELEEENTSLRHQLEEAESTTADLRDQNASLRQQLEDAELRAADLQDETASLRQQLDEADEKADRKAVELREENASLRQQLEEADERADGKAAQLREENAGLRQRLEEADSKSAALHDETATLRQKLMDAETKVTDLQGENATLRHELEDAGASAQALTAKLDKYKSAAQSLKSASRKKDLTIAQLKRDKESLATDLELAFTQASLAEQKVTLMEREQKRGRRESAHRRLSVHPHPSPLVPQSVNRLQA